MRKRNRKRYHGYMTSAAWQAQRLIALERAKYQCEGCGIKQKKGLHVHHLTYLNFGREKPEDLRVLCEHCHAKVHPHMKRVERPRYWFRRKGQMWEILDGKRTVTMIPTKELAQNFVDGANSVAGPKTYVKRQRPPRRRQRGKPNKPCRIYKVDPLVLREHGSEVAIAQALNRP